MELVQNGALLEIQEEEFNLSLGFDWNENPLQREKN